MTTIKREIRVLLAEDSPTVRYHLASLVNEIPGMSVIGEARNGEEALALTQQLHPDVVSMDIQMPRMDGLEATRRIMSQYPTPVVIVSGLLEREIDLAFQAIQAGAVAVVEKPPARHSPDFAVRQRHMINTLAAMAEVRVIRHWDNTPGQNPRRPNAQGRSSLRSEPEVIVIGSSAGGPSALSTALSALPADLPVPVLIAQHMPHEFIAGLARWLKGNLSLPVHIAEDGEILKPGVVHLAPGIAHLAIARSGEQLIARLLHDQGAHRYQPAVDVLMHSTAQVCGKRAVGVILTGMGDDGAAGLLAMRQAGARTLAQDEASCTVYGMPGAAVARGAVEQIVPLNLVSAALVNLVYT